MSERDDERTIRRILVALDASRHSLAALEAAAELAARLEAELLGLFVEDATLLRLARLPVAREVRYPYDAPARLDQAQMERQLRAQAAQARRALAEVSERRHVKWSFRVVRGEVASEVLTAATEADLLTLGKASRPLTRRVRLGSTALAAAEEAPCCVLVLQRDAGIKTPMVVAYDGTPGGQRALAMAARLAGREAGNLDVLILTPDLEAVRRLQAEASGLLRGRGLALRFHHLKSATSAGLIHEARAAGGGTLVLSHALLPRDQLQTVLDEAECPVMLVR